MKKNIKKQWLAALNSGKYKQGQEELLCIDEDGDKYYCCLGVLCNLWAKEKHKKMPRCNDVLEALPPDEILEWAGLSYADADRLSKINDYNDVDQFKKVSKEIKKL